MMTIIAQDNIPLDTDREDDILEGPGFFVDRRLIAISARQVSGVVIFFNERQASRQSDL